MNHSLSHPPIFPPLHTHMLRFCFAFSMSFLISGVMLNRSFLGIGRGTVGDLPSSGFFLHREMVLFDQTFGMRLCYECQSLDRNAEEIFPNTL